MANRILSVFLSTSNPALPAYIDLDVNPNAYDPDSIGDVALMAMDYQEVFASNGEQLPIYTITCVQRDTKAISVARGKATKVGSSCFVIFDITG